MNLLIVEIPEDRHKSFGRSRARREEIQSNIVKDRKRQVTWENRYLRCEASTVKPQKFPTNYSREQPGSRVTDLEPGHSVTLAKIPPGQLKDI